MDDVNDIESTKVLNTCVESQMTDKLGDSAEVSIYNDKRKQLVIINHKFTVPGGKPIKEITKPNKPKIYNL